MEKGKEMVKAQADLPKKNAAPAEPAKSLAGTIQQVISKAVTSPTDAKIDFAQGVNHITGDPQQKSAGPADAMQSLKAMNMKPQSEVADKDKMETYGEAEDKEKEMKKELHDKEKKDMKEVADKDDKKMQELKAEVEKMKKELHDKEKMMKAQKEKEINEGEMPAGLKKYLDKKNDKSEEDEKKKDMKEVADKEKEMKKEVADKEKKEKMDEVADKEKEMKKEVADKDKKDDMKEVAEKDPMKKEMMKAQAEIDKMKKEVADKEKAMKEMAMKKKEDMKEVADKEKKESAKEKVKDMDMKEDVDALTSGEDLSEEFKAKAATIFEGAVKAKLVEEIEKLESEYETKVDEKVSEVKEEIVDKVDAYLNYVVEEWMKENELAIEKGLRNEITEDFIGGLKSLFESHYINVPQEKYDVIESQAAEIEKLKEEVNQTIEKNVELNQKVSENNRQAIINDVSSDLAATEAEKLGKLAESIEYKDAESFRNSVETLKNSYYPKQEASDNESNEVAANAGSDLSESMAAYTAAISKSKKNPYLK